MLLGGVFVYKLMVFLGYQKILDLENIQTFERGRN
jgi:hypothetical protein